MLSLNKVLLIGNLVDDPRELRQTGGGTPVTSFRIAVNDPFAKDRERERTLFIDVVVFGRTAENCHRFLAKGRGALVEGRLQNDSWETPDGEKRSKIEIVANQVTFIGGRDDDRDGGGGGSGGGGGGGSRGYDRDSRSESRDSRGGGSSRRDQDRDQDRAGDRDRGGDQDRGGDRDRGRAAADPGPDRAAPSPRDELKDYGLDDDIPF